MFLEGKVRRGIAGAAMKGLVLAGLMAGTGVQAGQGESGATQAGTMVARPESTRLFGVPLEEGDDCAGGLVYDDGTYKEGGSGNPVLLNEVRMVHWVTPTFYPGTIRHVCMAFSQTTGNTELDLDIESTA